MRGTLPFDVHFTNSRYAESSGLNKLWEAHGKSVLERLVVTEPGKLATIACGLLPRDVFIDIGAWQ